MAKNRKYKSHGFIPFNKPQPETVYSRIRRSSDPLKTAFDLGIVDTEKIRKIFKDMGKMLLTVSVAAVYYVVILVAFGVFHYLIFVNLFQNIRLKPFVICCH